MKYLVSVEGGEFTGKTVVAVPAVENFFLLRGYEVITSREPGGSKKAEAMRKDIFEKLRQGIGVEEQALLFNQVRKIHINEVIRPFLASGDNKAIILDRYLDSTRVYQGLEGNLNFEKIKEFETKYVGNVFPNITMILYFPENKFETVLRQRTKSALMKHGQANEITPFDNATIQEHLQRQRYYLQLPGIAKQNNENRHFLQIDASGTPDHVANLISKKISPLVPFVTV